MELDIIGYRYTTDELSVLAGLQGYETIPAIPSVSAPDREQFARGMESLEDNDILSNVSGQLLLDRIQAFLINQICECGRYLSVTMETKQLAACVCEKVAVLMTTRDGVHWVIRVAPNPQDLREELDRGIQVFQGECTFRTAMDGETGEQTIPDGKTLAQEVQAVWAVLKKRENLFT